MNNKDKRPEIYFMVDVEADGPIPGPYSMNSFGIVAAVRREGNEITNLDLEDPINQFYAELKPISDDFLPDAIAVGGFDHEQLKITGRDNVEAMTAVAAWVKETVERYDARLPVFSAFPLGFDWMFFYWYLMNFSKTGSPFAHSRHYDVKTAYAEKAGVGITSSVKRLMPRKLFSNSPHTHNALDDAVEQGYLLQNLMVWDGLRD